MFSQHRNDCTYLGHQIGRGGVRPEESKIQAVADLRRPTTKKDVRTFLGMAGYYRRFVHHFATIAEPLTELTKKNKPDKIAWTNAAELAFQRLKKVLISAPLMRNPDFSRPFVLQTDASGVGVGAVWVHGKEGNGKLKRTAENGRGLALNSPKTKPKTLKTFA